MSVTAITGPMFADKTTTLIKLIRGTQGHVTVIRPSTDTRYSTERIVSHSGDYFSAAGCDPDKIVDFAAGAIGHVFIDEGHFFPDLSEAVNIMIANGCESVTVAGIDLDYKKKPFANMQMVINMAKNRIICRAICACGKFASYTKMLEKTNAVGIVVGGSEKYAPHCGSAECET